MLRECWVEVQKISRVVEWKSNQVWSWWNFCPTSIWLYLSSIRLSLCSHKSWVMFKPFEHFIQMLFDVYPTFGHKNVGQKSKPFKMMGLKQVYPVGMGVFTGWAPGKSTGCFEHFKAFSCKEIQSIQTFCLSMKNSCPPAQNLTATPWPNFAEMSVLEALDAVHTRCTQHVFIWPEMLENIVVHSISSVFVLFSSVHVLVWTRILFCVFVLSFTVKRPMTHWRFQKSEFWLILELFTVTCFQRRPFNALWLVVHIKEIKTAY